MRRVVIVVALAAVSALVTAVNGLAGPSPVNITFHEHKTTNTLSGVDAPCLPGVTGTLTEVENGIGHLQAAGIDQGNPNDPNDDQPLPPAHWTLAVENQLHFAPDDRSLPTYDGHSRTHLTWDSTKTKASFEDQVIMAGSDGSSIKWHETAVAVFDLGQLTSPDEGIVDVTRDKPRCY